MTNDVLESLRVCSNEGPCTKCHEGMSRKCISNLTRKAADSMENLQTENATLRRHIDNLTSAQAVMVKEFDKKLEELDAYKRTGLSPDDIVGLKNTYDQINYINDSLYQANQKMGKDLSEWKKAHDEGRMVVLPCGTDAELVRDGYTFKADHWNHTLTAFRDEPKNKSGKQVALFSMEEAKAALSEKESTSPDAPEKSEEPEWKSRVMRTFLGGR